MRWIYSFSSQSYKFLGLPLLMLYLGRSLTQEDFALILVSYSLSVIVCSLVDYGLQYIVMIGGNGVAQRSIVKTHLVVKLIVLLLMSLPLGVYLEFYAMDLPVMLIFIVSGVVFSFANYFVSHFRCLGRFDVEFKANTLGFLMLASYVLMTNSPDILIFSGVLLLSRVITVIFLVLKFHNLKSFVTEKVDFKSVSSVFLVSFPMFLLTVLATLGVNLDAVIVSSMLKPELLAVYLVYFRVMMISMVIPESLTAIFLPKIASMLGQDNHGLTSALRQLTIILLIFSVFSAVFYVALSPVVIPWFFGEAYKVDSQVIYLITGVMILRILGSLFSVILLSLRLFWYRVNGLILSNAISVVCLMYFVSDLGVVGVAVSSFMAHLVLNGCYVFYSNVGVRNYVKKVFV